LAVGDVVPVPDVPVVPVVPEVPDVPVVGVAVALAAGTDVAVIAVVRPIGVMVTIDLLVGWSDEQVDAVG
jgi:hypothetical protein